jgi:ERCC4-related helicase
MPTDIIDNSTIKLSDALKEKISVSKTAHFAVGWFFLTGLKEIKDEIDNLKNLQILVGSKTNRQTAELMLLEKKYESAVDDALKSKKYLNQQEIYNILDEEFSALIKHISCIKPTKENVKFVKWFFEKLRQKKIEIRIYPKETLHAKLYLLNYKDTRHGQGMAFVGSSNISMSGFNLNTELNVAVYGDENHKYLSEWFSRRWKESERTDFTVLAQKALKKSWVMSDEVTPFRIYLRVLDEIFSFEEEREIPETKYGEVELWDFQRDAVIDAYHRLNEYNGVFLADVPGMGKTYMGAALLAHLQEDGKRAIVICPPKLVEQWKDVLSEFGVGTARVFSIGKLDEIINSEKLLMRDIVLIDESHHLRNPETNRYRDMEIICEGKKVILVGATPQNLNIWDLYYQMKLFTPSEMNHKFRIDPPSLKGFFKAFEDEKADVDIEDLISQIVIRRTRKDIIDYYGKGKIPHFPKRIGPKRIDYSIDKVYPGGIYKKLNELISRMRFARYDIGSYIKEEKFTLEERQRIKQAGKNLRKLIQIILFRRLESSIVAFRDSVDLMHRSHTAFRKALDEEKVLAGESREEVINQLKAGTNLEDLEIPESAYPVEKFYAEALKEDILKDEKIVSEALNLVKDIKPEEDDKLNRLIDLLNSEVKAKKTIIFTAFASTAKYLGKELQKRFDKVDYVTQATGQVLTKAKRFSPKSNGYRIKPSEEINILVSTELLSEGLNLQDGEVVINYELHWNPVRIIQRIGRIDRIGSENDKIWVYNFFPQQEAEKEINVEKKVKTRINEIIRRFGADEKTISQDEQEVRKKLFQIYTEDKSSLEEEERESKSNYFRHEWLKLQNEFPEDYKIALGLPAMVSSAIDSKHRGIAVFCRADDYFRLMLSDENGEIKSRNDWDILKLVECNKATDSKSLLSNHLDVIEKVREQFEKEVNKREAKKKLYLEKIKAQIIHKLERLKRGQTERIKKEIDEIISDLREAYLSNAEKRELRKIRNKHGLLLDEILKELRKTLQNTPKQEPVKFQKKYAQVILSESLY